MKNLGLPGLVVALLAACSGAPDETPPAAAATPAGLTTLVVEKTRTESETRFDGVIEAVNQATVAAQTSGRVVELPFDVGDYVKQGDVIARLTGVEQKAQAGSAAATLSEASTRLSEAKLQYDRVADLFGRGVVAKAAVDRAKADFDSASARVEAARNALAQAREQADYTVVRAPYNGIVVKRHIEVGETVSVGRPLLSGLSLEHLRAVVEVSQEHIGPLRSHKKARVLLPDGRSVAASELRIPPSADAMTHTFRVLVTLPPGDYGAFPGTLVKVAFVSGEQEQVLVPAAALLRRAEITAVYVVDVGVVDGGALDAAHLSLRYVRVGTPGADGRVPVLAGLQPGEYIVADAIAGGLRYKAGAAPAEGSP
jgi:RND family efflux transporter MFP subunit